MRDTKLEKANHDATPKHQGNLKRFLRDLHRGHERDERDKQRAKDEVNRLNGVVSGVGGLESAGPGVTIRSSSTSGGNTPWTRQNTAYPSSSIAAANTARQPTPAERRQQLSQLADLGIAVPEEFRREMAMAGEWQVVSERVLHESGVKDEHKKEEGCDEEKMKSGPEGINIGVHKRKYNNEAEEEDEVTRTMMGGRKAWGSMIQTYSAAVGDALGSAQEDLDSLLGNTQLHRRLSHRSAAGEESSAGGKLPQVSTPTSQTFGHAPLVPSSSSAAATIIKQEDPAPDPHPYRNPDLNSDPTMNAKPLTTISSLKNENENDSHQQPAEIVFKRRKAKPNTTRGR